MYSIRRAALRSVISASRQVAPKASTSPFAAQTASGTTAVSKHSLVQVVRCFSQTARFQNVEEKPESALNELEEAAAPEPAASETLASDPFASSESVSEKKAQGSPVTPPNGVFVRNLIFDATDKHLWAAFEKFGEVVECNVARDARGLSKGYGFVYFKDADSVQQAVAAVDGTFWHGRRVACSPRTYNNTNNSSGFAPKNKSLPSEPSTTLYIGNIPYETTDAELNNIFKNLKNVTDIRVAVDRTTGWPRGFAHADFANVDSAIEAYKVLQGMQLGTRTLSVDYSASRKFVRNTEAKTRS